MKYQININQKVIVEAGLGLDLANAAILDFCCSFASSTRCRFMVEGNKRYYWFAHNLIREGLPILQLQKSSIYRRMRMLCDSGLLEAHPDNMRLSASWYCFTPKADLLTHVSNGDPAQKNEWGHSISSEGATAFVKGNYYNKELESLSLNKEDTRVHALPDLDGDSGGLDGKVENVEEPELSKQPSKQKANRSKSVAATTNLVLTNCKFPGHWVESMKELYATRWIPFRQKVGRKLLLLESAQAQIEKLSELSEDQLTACIGDSIANSWTGLFPEKHYNTQRNTHELRNNTTRNRTNGKPADNTKKPFVFNLDTALADLQRSGQTDNQEGHDFADFCVIE